MPNPTNLEHHWNYEMVINGSKFYPMTMVHCSDCCWQLSTSNSDLVAAITSACMSSLENQGWTISIHHILYCMSTWLSWFARKQPKATIKQITDDVRLCSFIRILGNEVRLDVRIQGHYQHSVALQLNPKAPDTLQLRPIVDVVSALTSQEQGIEEIIHRGLFGFRCPLCRCLPGVPTKLAMFMLSNLFAGLWTHVDSSQELGACEGNMPTKTHLQIIKKGSYQSQICARLPPATVSTS